MNGLSRIWKDWRRHRVRELQMTGMPRVLASDLAGREAKARQTAEGLVGHDLARKGMLITSLRPDGTYSMYLKAPIEDIPEADRSRANAWSAAENLHSAFRH
ncbi:hypothetical protein SAMN05880582_102196 [Rhizobium sp. RU20A]|uniref:hypothetical protein n=1 Tax=Rhizobium sp. RU20A TaxID=1907412 RepID=UPI000953CA61|nr:hypothetical protein [Rhizobium sp. RU20A]SIQ58054.1 hypothetical protein SAMN05880582_102196 [Rhizobium sp. RU20A]